MPSCSCFSLCRPQEAAAFLDAIPSTPPADSPWHGYLREVFGPRGVPPHRSLKRFGFFYHRHKDWPPEVEWPMAPCTKTCMAGACPAPTRQHSLRCEPAVCSRWFAPGASFEAALEQHANYSALCPHERPSCLKLFFAFRGKKTTGTLLQSHVMPGRQARLLAKRVEDAAKAPGGSTEDGGPAARVSASTLAAWRGDDGAGGSYVGREQIEAADHRWTEVVRVNDLAYGLCAAAGLAPHAPPRPTASLTGQACSPVARSAHKHRQFEGHGDCAPALRLEATRPAVVRDQRL